MVNITFIPLFSPSPSLTPSRSAASVDRSPAGKQQYYDKEEFPGPAEQVRRRLFATPSNRICHVISCQLKPSLMIMTKVLPPPLSAVFSSVHSADCFRTQTLPQDET